MKTRNITFIGTPGEYWVEETIATEEIVSLIETYERGLALNDVPEPFVIRKLGIVPTADATLIINGRDYAVPKDEALEFGLDMTAITSIISDTADIGLKIRYLY